MSTQIKYLSYGMNSGDFNKAWDIYAMICSFESIEQIQFVLKYIKELIHKQYPTFV